MRRYLLDAGPAQDCIFHRLGLHERVAEVRQQGHRVGISLPGLGEILGGMELSDNRDESLKIVRRTLKMFVLWPFDTIAAGEYGKIYAHLRRIGRPIQQIDMQIAAIARTLKNCTVVSYDTDLSFVPGLVVEDWRR